MNKKSEHGSGTIRAIRGKGGRVTGYQPLLPRHLSKAPSGVKNPSRYQEALGSPLPTWDEARRLLDAALVELRERRFDPKFGLPLSAYAHQAIRARRSESFREHKSAAKADRDAATWKSADKRWLSKAPFYGDPPDTVDAHELGRWFKWLKADAVSAKGEPLSGHFIRHLGALLTATFDCAGIKPNPMTGVELPAKGAPRVPFLDLASQRRLFCADIPMVDRLMIGCGMGAGLRVGELLAMEVSDVHLDIADPHVFVRFGGPNQGPPKGRRNRRVELFEPGLGFWRRWLADHYAGGARVFGGPKGGFQKAWPERFQGWAERAGKRSLTSHIMRHTYAVSMLSGTWGYEPVGLEFVSEQLGHADRQTTERYYGAFEAGTWVREVRRFTGRSDGSDTRVAVTAAELLGELDATNEGGTAFLARINPAGVRSPSSTQSPEAHENSPESDADQRQGLSKLADLATEVLTLADERSVWFASRSIDLAKLALELADRLTPALTSDTARSNAWKAGQ